MNSFKRTGIAALAFLLIVSFVLVSGSVFARATEIAVTDNGTTAFYTTEAKTVAEFFAEQEIEIGEDDLIIPAIDASLDGVDEIRIYRAADITVSADGEEYTLRTAATSVQEAVERVTDLSENDTVIPSRKTMVEDGMKITVYRAKNIYFTYYGYTAEIVTSEETVDSFLEARGILLDDRDEISPERAARIHEGMEITVSRYEVKTETRQVNIPFKTETKENRSLPQGKTKVVREGVDGAGVETLEVAYRNGKIESSAIIGTTVLKEPVSQITEVGASPAEPKATEKKTTVKKASAEAIGTGQSASGGSASKENKKSADAASAGSANTDGGDKGFSYSRVLTCTATAYDASAESNGKWAGQTASGIPLERGVVAVDPRVIPLGTRLYIEAVDGSWTYGYAVAGDTGGAIKGNKVDLFMDTNAECIRFGRRQCKVYVLN